MSLTSLLSSPLQKPEAEKILRAAIADYETLVAANPTKWGTQVSLAGAYCNMGLTVRDTQGPAASLPWYAKAETTLNKVLKQAPTERIAKSFLANTLFNRELTREQLRQFDEADQDWERAPELSTGPERELRQKARAAWKRQRPPMGSS